MPPIRLACRLATIAGLVLVTAMLEIPAAHATGSVKTKADSSGETASIDPGVARPATLCPLPWPYRYCYSGPVNVAIPDNTDTGVLVGAVPVPPDGLVIDDVAVTVNMAHSYAGDVVLAIWYDINNDGFGDIGPASLMCTPGINGCDIESCCGCGGNLNGEYLFSDAGSGVLGEVYCTQQLSPDCYQPDPAFGSLQMFDGAPDGGQFLLYAWDFEAQDTGTVFDFMVAARLGCGHPVLNVPADYPTVQAAVDAACDGDTIRIAPGTYGDVFADFEEDSKLIILEAADPNNRPTFGNVELRNVGSGSAVRDIVATALTLVGHAPVTVSNVNTSGDLFMIGFGDWATVKDCSVGGVLDCGGYKAFVQNCTAGSIDLEEQAVAQVEGCITNSITINCRDFGGATVRENTILGNGSGGVLLLVRDFVEPVIIERNLLVGGPSGNDDGVALFPTGSGSVTKICNDVWRCSPRWTGTSDPTGSSGNISVDPNFCNAAAGNYFLNSQSPCVPGHHPNGANCGGLIGALPVGCPTTAIDDAPLSEIPLVSAAPNPAHGQVTFSLAAGNDQARLQIFDASGRSVRTINVPPGNGSRIAVWDQRDDSGNEVASGMYFYRASMSGREMMQRLIVLR